MAQIQQRFDEMVQIHGVEFTTAWEFIKHTEFWQQLLDLELAGAAQTLLNVSHESTEVFQRQCQESKAVCTLLKTLANTQASKFTNEEAE